MSIQVHIPTPLRSYTAGAKQVTSDGRTTGELMEQLNLQYPGIRFRIIDEQDRIREHMRIFVNSRRAMDLRVPLDPGDKVEIICAISGG